MTTVIQTTWTTSVQNVEQREQNNHKERAAAEDRPEKSK